MKIRLLKRFRKKASKDIRLRRISGNRYEIVCKPKSDVNSKQWVIIDSNMASINFGMCSKINVYVTRVPFKNINLTLHEAEEELIKIQRGYIIYHLIPSYCRKLPLL